MLLKRFFYFSILAITNSSNDYDYSSEEKDSSSDRPSGNALQTFTGNWSGTIKMFGKFGKEQAAKATRSLLNAGTDAKMKTYEFMGHDTKSKWDTAKSYMKWGFCLGKPDSDEDHLAEAVEHAKEILRLKPTKIEKFFKFQGDEKKKFTEYFCGSYKKRIEAERLNAEQKKQALGDLIYALKCGIFYVYVKCYARTCLLQEEKPDLISTHPSEERLSRDKTRFILYMLKAIYVVLEAAGEEVQPIKEDQIKRAYQKLKSKAMQAAEKNSNILHQVAHEFETDASQVMEEYHLYLRNFLELGSQLDRTKQLVQDIEKMIEPRQSSFCSCEKKKRENIQKSVEKQNFHSPDVLFAFDENERKININYDGSQLIGYNPELCEQNKTIENELSNQEENDYSKITDLY